MAAVVSSVVQVYEYGPDPPTAASEAVPFASPKQSASVVVDVA